MFALIYIFATAKPISMRRLSLLFVLVLISATLVLRVLQVTTPGGALLSATLVTLFVWSTPLLHIMRATVSRRALSLDALRQVSGFVCWTYGFAIAAMPIVAVSAILNPTQSLHPALPRLLVIAEIVALASTMFVPKLQLRRSRGRAPSAPYMARRRTCCCAASVARVSRQGQRRDIHFGPNKRHQYWQLDRLFGMRSRCRPRGRTHEASRRARVELLTD